MNRYVSSFIAISNTVSLDWVTAGLDPSKMIVIYNGIIPSAAKHLAVESEDKVLKIVMVGSLCEQKGQDQLISAISQLGDVDRKKISVDFYGDGKDKYVKNLRQLIERNDLSDICTIKGYDCDIRQRLGQYDVGIICSKAEGFGMVTVEYMMAGLCPVVSDTGANTEIVEANKSGLVYRYGDSKDLLLKIQYLINHPGIRGELAEKSKGGGNREI